MTVRKDQHRRHFGFYPEVDLLKANWLVVGTLITRDLFLRIGGFSDYPHGFEDWSAWYKATRLGARVVKVPKALYIQHVNPQSKHRQGWRDRRWQVATHQRVERELAAWQP
jgi:GT2 family glycosyltransferase